LSSASGTGGDILRKAGTYFADTLSTIADLFVILIISVYFAAETGVYRSGFLQLFPRRVRPRVGEIVDATSETVDGWMQGQLISIAFLGTATYFGLLLIGVPLALILGVIAGLLTIIPYFGPILAAVPIVLVALTDSPSTGLYAFLYFVVVQNLEGNLVTPMAQRKAVDLPPVLLLSAQVILGSLIGFWGVLLAAPLTAVGLLLVKMLYVEGVLEDQAV
jgi:predicted PurR-regulated permease PerM